MVQAMRPSSLLMATLVRVTFPMFVKDVEKFWANEIKDASGKPLLVASP